MICFNVIPINTLSFIISGILSSVNYPKTHPLSQTQQHKIPLIHRCKSLFSDLGSGVDKQDYNQSDSQTNRLGETPQAAVFTGL